MRRVNVRCHRSESPTRRLVIASAGIMVLGLSSAATVFADPTLCGTWGFVPTPTPATGGSVVYGVGATSSADAWAVGYTADVTQSLAMHWDGNSWNIVPTPSPSGTTNFLASVVTLAPDDAWAVGSFNAPGGGNTGLPTVQTLALHWDGSTWSLRPSPAIFGGTAFNAVSALATNDIWAVGLWSPGAPGPDEAPLTAHWDGSSWQVVSAPHVALHINRLFGVSARTASDVWAVGTWKDLVNPFHILILHWDGGSWSVVTSADPGINDQLNAVASIAANDAWTVGERYDTVAGSQPLIMHWNGASWSQHSLPVFPGEFNRLNAIAAVSANDIWASGATAAVAGGPPLPLLMHWDGISWSVVASAATDGTSEYFGGLAVVGGCDVWSVGSYQRDGILVPLTERLQAQIALGASDGFSGPGQALSVAPNPTHGACKISLQLARNTVLRSDIFDARGRKVRSLGERLAPAGPVSLVWDGRDDHGAALAAGLYFVRVQSGTESRLGRVIVR